MAEETQLDAREVLAEPNTVSSGPLEPEQKLEIQSYVGSLIRGWLAWLGVTNVVVLVTALAYLYFFATDKVSDRAVQVANSRVADFIAKLDDKPMEIAEGSGEVKRLLIQLNSLTSDLPEREMQLRESLSTLEQKLAEIETSEAYKNGDAILALNQAGNASQILEILRENRSLASELDGRLNELAAVVTKVAGTSIRFRQKTGNDGTASCETFCAGRLWGDWTGTCVGAKLVSGGRSGDYVGCGHIPGLGNILICTCSELP